MYQYGGFVFETEEQMLQAKKEAEGIRYIKAQTRMDNPDVVLKLYHKLLSERLFETEIGIAFLIELQEYLHTIPYIKNEEIRPIPIRGKANVASEESQKKVRKEPKEKSYRGAYRITLFLSIVFAVIIVGMFTITYLSGKSTNIINYENEIIDKYVEWEQELNEREEQLEKREKMLEERDK